MKLLLAGLVCWVASQSAWANPYTVVDAKQFIERVQGPYLIELAGGQVPKVENSAADVFADTDEGLFTLPFCGSNGLCDPGYLNFGYTDTRVTLEKLTNGNQLYTMLIGPEGKVSRYTWEEASGKVIFTNYQYKIGSQITRLQHVMRRVTQEE